MSNQTASGTIYTCPMHPEIERDRPGNCPICGMALEPKSSVAGGEEENAELRDMTQRFWIGLALTIPVLVLAMAHVAPHPGCKMDLALPHRQLVAESASEHLHPAIDSRI